MADTLRGRTLLAVFAHPDDESLTCGGLLAMCADEGMRVILVCATRGEDGQDGSAESSGRALGARRTRELASAADVLGIDAVTLLDFEDGMLPWIDGDDLDDAVAGALARWAPDAVVTFDEDGLYWHPDHIAIHRATTAAVQESGPEAPALYYASLPEGMMRALVDTVKDRVPVDRLRVLGVEDADAFGTLAPHPTIVLNVEATVPRKLVALRCHETQVRGGPLSVITDAEAVRFLGVEQLRRAPVGNTDEPILELLSQRT
jgi:LmbE family N-acetylglucosaminyl deacetylase